MNMGEAVVASSALFCLVCVFALLLWFGKKEQNKEAEKGRKHHNEIRDIFVEIGECFARQGFFFDYKIKDGGYSGSTFVMTASGGYINIEECFLGPGGYMIELRQNNFGDVTTPNEEKVRAIIHQEIVEELIRRQRSPNSRYFLRQDLLALKEIGIEKVVAGLIGLQREHDRIWSELEDRKVLERFVAFLDLCDNDRIRFLEAIELVIDENFPRTEVPTV